MGSGVVVPSVCVQLPDWTYLSLSFSLSLGIHSSSSVVSLCLSLYLSHTHNHKPGVGNPFVFIGGTPDVTDKDFLDLVGRFVSLNLFNGGLPPLILPLDFDTLADHEPFLARAERGRVFRHQLGCRRLHAHPYASEEADTTAIYM